MFYGAYLNIFKYFIGAYSSRQETSTLFAWDFAIQLFVTFQQHAEKQNILPGTVLSPTC